MLYQSVGGRQHDDSLGVMVPDHSPEVFSGVGQRMLGNDELLTVVVTLQEVRTTVEHHLNSRGHLLGGN